MVKLTQNHGGTNELSRKGHLVFFRAGGVRFAVETTSIVDVTDDSWTSPEGNRVFLLAELLDLPSQRGTRTLVVETSQGTCGFVVDLIFNEDITLHTIAQVPPLLQAWMKLPVVTGFSTTQNKLHNVLDLRNLAERTIAHSLLEDTPTKDQTR